MDDAAPPSGAVPDRAEGRPLRRLRAAAPIAGLAALAAAFFWQIALTNRILAGLDVLTFFYPYRAFATEAIRAGRLPLWNPFLFGGAPFLADSQSAVLYPVNLLLNWLPVPSQLSYSIAIHTFLAGALMFLFARRSLHLTHVASLSAAVVFAFGGFLGAQAEHINQLSASMWLPLMLYLWGRAWAPDRDGSVRRFARRLPALVGLAGVVAIGLLAGHAQASYITLAALVLYAAWRFFAGPVGTGGADDGRTRRPRAGAYLAGLTLAAGLALGLAAVQLAPTVELSAESVRAGGLAYRQAASFSLKPGLLLTSLLPAYRSGVFSEYIAYVGVLPILLAVVGASLSRDRRARSFALTCVGLGLFLALGAYNPVYYLLYRVVPGLSLFRVPARWLLLYHLGVSLLAGLGMNAIADRQGALRGGWKRWRAPLVVLGALAATLGLASPWLEKPSPPVIVAWLGTALGGVLLLALAQARRGKAAVLLLAAGIVAELFAASRSLAYSRTTAPQAYYATEPAVAHLRSAPDHGRILTLTDLTFDPGNMTDLVDIFGPQVSAEGLYDLKVASKQTEALIPNLPMIYGLSSLDGYGGGILPLRQYYEAEPLFVAPERAMPDGRLWQSMREIPSARLLSAFGVRYVIADKVADVWLDGVYYDLSHRAHLGQAEAVTVEVGAAVAFQATAIGIVSHLDGAGDAPHGAEVGALVVAFPDGTEQRLPLRAGDDTSEGVWNPALQHGAARVARTWREDPTGRDYVTVLRLSKPGTIRGLHIEGSLAAGALVVRGVSLVDGRTATFWPLIASTAGRFEVVHTGAIKVYEVLDSPGRAYLAHDVRTSKQPLLDMGASDLDPSQVLLVEPGAEAFATPVPDGDRLEWVVDEPERIVIQTSSQARSALVLSDAYYPGWSARIDGCLAPIYRANGLMRAVYLDAGDHRVEMMFRPGSVAAGAVGSVVAAVAALGLLVWGIRAPRRGRSGPRA